MKVMGKKTGRSNGQNNKRRADALGWWASLRARLQLPVQDVFGVSEKTKRLLLVAFLYALFFALATSGTTPDGVDWQPGDVATHDIVAGRSVVNREQTELLRERAAREAVLQAEQDPANWEINPAEAWRAEQRLDQMFDELRAALFVDEPDDAMEKGAGSATEAESTDETPEVAGEEAEAVVPDETALAEKRERLEEILAEEGIVLSDDGMRMLAAVDDTVFDGWRRRSLEVVRALMGSTRVAAEDLDQIGRASCRERAHM